MGQSWLESNGLVLYFYERNLHNSHVIEYSVFDESQVSLLLLTYVLISYVILKIISFKKRSFSFQYQGEVISFMFFFLFFIIERDNLFLYKGYFSIV